MLTMPQASSNLACIIGVDPGSNNLGVAVLHFDIATLQIVSVEAWTLVGVKLAREHPWTTELHGDLEGRIQGMKAAFFNTLQYFQPLIVVSEAPFISKKFPQAGLVLTRVVAAVRQAVMQFDFWKALDIIDPPSVKNAVGAAGNANKDVMKEKVIALGLPYVGSIPMEQLDEHSIDAIAVAYGRFNRMLEELCLKK